jgi:hypothetical protein
MRVTRLSLSYAAQKNSPLAPLNMVASDPDSSKLRNDNKELAAILNEVRLSSTRFV